MDAPRPAPDEIDPMDLTPEAAETVAQGVDPRRLTAGYDTDPAVPFGPPTEYDITEDEFTTDRDTLGQGTIDTETGMDFGVGGGRDVGSDIGNDVVSDTD
jgi:hypothetical protein